jgi:hypothetical protein
MKLYKRGMEMTPELIVTAIVILAIIIAGIVMITSQGRGLSDILGGVNSMP